MGALVDTSIYHVVIIYGVTIYMKGEIMSEELEIKNKFKAEQQELDKYKLASLKEIENKLLKKIRKINKQRYSSKLEAEKRKLIRERAEILYQISKLEGR